MLFLITHRWCIGVSRLVVQHVWLCTQVLSQLPSTPTCCRLCMGHTCSCLDRWRNLCSIGQFQEIRIRSFTYRIVFTLLYLYNLTFCISTCLTKHQIKTKRLTHNIFILHSCYRHLAYRNFVRWCWGYLGRHIRVVIPSCAVTRIRQEFPENEGNYTGFQLPPLD